jgi:ACS family tartrate transporter-like MFS transporter
MAQAQVGGSSRADLPPVEAPPVEAIERETMRRVARRLVPLLMVSYFAAYLDRVNVSFAALTMNKSLGFSAEVFGIGSGIFFLGYFLFEVPSNLIMSKVGARKWIARILLTWGVISGATAFVTGTWSFLGIRFLLGLAEAGFYPGIILYLTWWFPSAYRRSRSPASPAPWYRARSCAWAPGEACRTGNGCSSWRPFRR